MKSQRDIEDKLRELKGNRKTLHNYIEERGVPTTIPCIMALHAQQLDEYRITAKIEIVEWILKDHSYSHDAFYNQSDYPTSP